MITPAAARAPYIEADPASFKTVVFSISLPLRKSILVVGIPSTTYSGSLLLKDPKPRILTWLVVPGCPEVITVIPGTLP
jgi:hypothetical protein